MRWEQSLVRAILTALLLGAIGGAILGCLIPRTLADKPTDFSLHLTDRDFLVQRAIPGFQLHSP